MYRLFRNESVSHSLGKELRPVVFAKGVNTSLGPVTSCRIRFLIDMSVSVIFC